MVSDFAPAGDQPTAIAALTESIQRGDRFQTLLGITGSGKSATIGWTIEQVQKPTLVLAPNKSLAAQLANEFREFFPHNRVEYFVSYYDYYQPEAYIASSRHLHREGLVGERRDRPAAARGHLGAAHPARRDRGRVGVLHLRPRLARGVPQQHAPPPGGHRGRPARRAAQARRHALRAQRHEPRARQVPGAGRHHRGAPRLRGDGGPHRAVRRRDRAHPGGRPAHRRAGHRARRARDLPGHPLRHRRRAHARGDRAHRGGAPGAARLVREGGQAPRGAAPADAHPVRPRDDAGGRLLQRDRELLGAARRPRPRRGAEHAARLLPRRLPHGHGREPPVRAAAPRPVRGRPLPQGAAHRARLPPARAPPTTGRCASRR